MDKWLLIRCPICNGKVDRLIYRFHLDTEKHILALISKEFPEWTTEDGLCSRCHDFFQTKILMKRMILPEIGPQFPVRTPDDYIVIPTGLRVNADPAYTGKGITICFIDSGFYIHPDLTATRNRIKAHINITGKSIFVDSRNSEWHGTMTSVVCAGDGYLSKGLYKGIASEADLVLLKVQDSNRHITTENICKALQWVLENHEAYNIRVVNMSLGTDQPSSYKESLIDRLAETLIETGITVVAAVGNDEHGSIRPPANSLNVISVGGVDDQNKLARDPELYHSSFGKTIDGLVKPEIISNSIWISAPILPGSDQQQESGYLFGLLEMNDSELLKTVEQKGRVEFTFSQETDVNQIREVVRKKIQVEKYISPHYMHVDGTSFAAPIVTAIIAQLLQANPELTPVTIREVLFSTAKRINGVPAERQGFGVIQPRKALLKVLKRKKFEIPQASPFINKRKKCIEFYLYHDCATQVSLAGSFNNWDREVLLMEPGTDGLWKIEVPLLPDGVYKYKFFVDEHTWIEDYINPFREPDGFNGFNSLLIINQNLN